MSAELKIGPRGLIGLAELQRFSLTESTDHNLPAIEVGQPGGLFDQESRDVRMFHTASGDDRGGRVEDRDTPPANNQGGDANQDKPIVDVNATPEEVTAEANKFRTSPVPVKSDSDYQEPGELSKQRLGTG